MNACRMGKRCPHRLSENGSADHFRIVVTAGPTREHLDPVRFLSNPSTGKMGFAIAAEAARRGHDVTLIAGPVALKTPKDVKRVDVVSAREMLAAAVESCSSCSSRASGARHPSITSFASHASQISPAVFISTAAVADWRPAKCAAKKLKKGEMSSTLKLVRNPDILKTINRTIERFVLSDSPPRRTTFSPKRCASVVRRASRSSSPMTSPRGAVASARTPTR